MSATRTKFYLDKQNRKWLGVCSGSPTIPGSMSRSFGSATVLLTLATSGNLIIAYLVIAWIANPKPNGLYETVEDQKFWQGVRTNPRAPPAMSARSFAISIAGLPTSKRRTRAAIRAWPTRSTACASRRASGRE